VLVVTGVSAIFLASKGHSSGATVGTTQKTSSPEQVVSLFYKTGNAATRCQLESDRMLKFYYELDQSTPNPTIASGPMDFCIQDERSTIRIVQAHPFHDFHVGRAEILGDRASVPVSWVNAGGKSHYAVSLVKAGGVWRIDDIS
jgi:hypothetical protein